VPGDEPPVRQIGIQLLKQGLKNNGVGTVETICTLTWKRARECKIEIHHFDDL
jgi:hypothetical protein